MKIYLIFLFLSITYCGLSQDILYFKNGTVSTVKIVKIDSSAALVEYELNEQLIYGAISSFEKIIYQGTEIDLTYWAYKRTDNSQELTDKQLRKSNPFSYGKFAISTNLTSFVGSSRNDFRFFYDNSFFTIEPEYWFHDRVSVKFPIAIGMNANLDDAPIEVNQNSASWSYSTEFNADASDLPTPEIRNRSEIYTISQESFGHARSLQFQFGINPKFYFTENNWFMPYVGQSFNLAFVNLRTIDYYLTFSEELNFPSNNYFYTYREECQLISNSQSTVFKYEGMLGANFNISRVFTFSSEVGYSNLNKATNNTEDRVYVRTDLNGTYELAKTTAYNVAEGYSYGVNGRLFARVHLVLKFGGKKNE